VRRCPRRASETPASLSAERGWAAQMNSTLVLQAIVSGFLLGGVYSLICVGLTLTFGVMRIINFAHGEFLIFASVSGPSPIQQYFWFYPACSSLEF
jgi:Branched-chain amino acid transport system / permease component